jgi:hypothetical protein
MWTAVSQRKHTIRKVFPFGADGREVMLYGDVEYELRSGDKATVEWAGRAELEKSAHNGKYRMRFYQVYLVSWPSTSINTLFCSSIFVSLTFL